MSDAPAATCPNHFHDEDTRYWAGSDHKMLESPVGEVSRSIPVAHAMDKNAQSVEPAQQICDTLGFRGIIRNFTPSYVNSLSATQYDLKLIRSSLYRWFIITMSTGVTSIVIHQLPYHAHWLNIISDIFFVSFHLNSQIHHEPSVNPRGTASSPSKLVPRDLSSRTLNTHQHDRTSLCTGLGPRYGDFCMGIVVDRECPSGSCLLPLDMGNVRNFPSSSSSSLS
jgi:hypothetical protein